MRASATLALLLASLGVASFAETAESATTNSWTVYHGNVAGTGVATGLASVSTQSPRWISPSLNGELYGEPLVEGNAIYVATETNYVYALSSSTGHVLWSHQVAPPVPSSALPCGDIVPDVGITGTPVIEPARHELFVLADEMLSGHPHHVLVGLDLANGALKLRRDVDPAGSDPAALLQRTGLTLDRGRIVFAMGGNYGDCASYRGSVISVAESGANQETFTVDNRPGDSQGAIWMGGAAPVVDSSGNVWVSTGNGSVHSGGQAYDDSDGVLELSASMHLAQYFAPSDWPANNAADLDMSTAPVLLGTSQVLLAGKSALPTFLTRGTSGELVTTRLRSLCATPTSTVAARRSARRCSCPVRVDSWRCAWARALGYACCGERQRVLDPPSTRPDSSGPLDKMASSTGSVPVAVRSTKARTSVTS